MAEPESVLMSVRNHLRQAEEALHMMDFERAKDLTEQAIKIAREQDSAESLAAAYYGKAAVIWGSGGTSEDAHHYGNLAVQHSKPNTRTDLLVRTLMARIKAARGNYEAAILLNEDVLRYYYATEDWGGQADVLRSLGDVYRATGQFQTSEERYRAALAIYQNLDDPLNLTGLLMSLGALMYQQNNREQARQHWQEARAIAEGKGYRHIINQIDEALEELKHGL